MKPNKVYKKFAIGTASPSKALELSKKLDKKSIENAVFNVGVSKKVIVFNVADKKKVAKIPGIQIRQAKEESQGGKLRCQT